jgi:hypothetical protein
MFNPGHVNAAFVGRKIDKDPGRKWDMATLVADKTHPGGFSRNADLLHRHGKSWRLFRDIPAFFEDMPVFFFGN